jgi:tetratricopeptide (TPR) repeat protein
MCFGMRSFGCVGTTLLVGGLVISTAAMGVCQMEVAPPMTQAEGGPTLALPPHTATIQRAPAALPLVDQAQPTPAASRSAPTTTPSLATTTSSPRTAVSFSGNTTRDEVEDAEEPTSESIAARPVDPADELDVRVTAFKEVEPGTTTYKKLIEVWGEPTGETRRNNQAALTFKFAPFERVDVALVDDVVTTIVVNLVDPLPVREVVPQLQLTDVRAVPLPNESGELLGQAYPERGVTFGFDPDTKAPTVRQIIVDQVAAEPFVLRAKYDFGQAYESDLKDLNYALSLTPQDAEAHFLKAEILRKSGHLAAALQNASAAVGLQPNEVGYQICAARISADLGQFTTALTRMRKQSQREDLTNLERAQIECVLGDLLTKSSDRDYQAAAQRFVKSIELASPLLSDKRFVLRRDAKQVVIDAHLAMAICVASGNWQRKEEVSAKWLDRGQQLVEDFVKFDQGDPALGLIVHRRRLAANSALPRPIDPSADADAAIRQARELIARSPDGLYKQRIEWELGTALADAMQIEHRRGKQPEAIRYAETAVGLLEGVAGTRPLTARNEFQLGGFYFLVGSIHAIHNQNHKEAVAWFEKAEPRLSKEIPPALKSHQGRFGEWFVSMGVSHWQINSAEKAIELTEKGATMMKAAVDAGHLSEAALTVPYNNLAAMLENAGQADKAKNYATLATAIESEIEKR